VYRLWASNRHLLQQLPRSVLPKVQTAACDRLIAARRTELLPTRYVHVVFPAGVAEQEGHLPSPVSQQCGKPVEVARNPKRLGAEIAFFSVLHSWSQKLETHSCLAGGERSWISSTVSLSFHSTFDLQSSLALSPLAAMFARTS
jgi:hypothetical protein